jgi:P-type Cu+ transporter
MKKMKLKISGMHCVSCAMSIDGELEDMGAKSSSTNYAKQETEVEFDEKKLDLEKISSTIQKLGYSAAVKE